MTSNQFDPQYELLSVALGAYESPELRPLAERVFNALGYVINQVFDDSANEFLALGLTSVDGSKPPVLVLPGGRLGNPISVGNEEFIANKQAIRRWIKTITNDPQANPQGLKPDVTGASRGGALTQLVASAFPTLIGSAVTFVSPGIDQESAKIFLKNGGNPDQVRHYINDGDWRSLLGDAFIPGSVTVGTYKIPVEVPEGDEIDYATRKHSSGILADFSTLLPDTSDPTIARLRAITDIPADLTLSESSVQKLNRANFTFQGSDWQELVSKLKRYNPNLALLANREGLEDLRDSAKIDEALFDELIQAIAGTSSLTPEEANQPTDGNDFLLGANRNDQIHGEAGDDFIRTGGGDDRLFVGGGSDALLGKAGNDILSGGAGNDVLIGGTGGDQFVFRSQKPFGAVSLGVDQINDFTPGEDLIGLSRDTFRRLPGNFTNVFQVINVKSLADLEATAGASAALLVYDINSGSLIYNANGAGPELGNGGTFARLFNQPTLTARDFTFT
jgi:Ca2+-binding RTX toxin-like protein